MLGTGYTYRIRRLPRQSTASPALVQNFCQCSQAINPNSDFSTFRHFFGTFLEEFCSVFCRYLADISPKKYLKLWHLSFFGKIICTWQTFSIFLAKFRHIFGKKEVFGRLLEFGFCLSSEFWDKFWRKT